jgi:hypothetical protein
MCSSTLHKTRTGFLEKTKIMMSRFYSRNNHADERSLQGRAADSSTGSTVSNVLPVLVGDGAPPLQPIVGGAAPLESLTSPSCVRILLAQKWKKSVRATGSDCMQNGRKRIKAAHWMNSVCVAKLTPLSEEKRSRPLN